MLQIVSTVMLQCSWIILCVFFVGTDLETSKNINQFEILLNIKDIIELYKATICALNHQPHLLVLF